MRGTKKIIMVIASFFLIAGLAPHAWAEENTMRNDMGRNPAGLEGEVPSTQVPLSGTSLEECRLALRNDLTGCARWYGLQEKPQPDAWKYDKPEERHQRWYSVLGEPVPAPTREKVVILRGVHFDFDKANIRPDSAPLLDKNVDELKSAQTVRVRVEGHTDAVGSDQYNQRLSQKRAEAVKNYFISQGVDPSRITAVGEGESEPVADNVLSGEDNPEGRAKNRRVELHIETRTAAGEQTEEFH